MDLILKSLVNLLVVAICAALGGRAAAHLLESAYLLDGPSAYRPRAAPAAKDVPRKEYDQIAKRNVFCSGCVPSSSRQVGARKTSLHLELLSTLICRDDEWSMAIIREVASQQQDAAMFNQGKEIFGTHATVEKVMSKRVYLRNQGALEYLDLERAAMPDGSGEIDNGVRCAGKRCTVDRALVDNLLHDPALVFGAAGFAPAMNGGFKIFAIRPKSIFEKIGLQNGDVIRAINGNELTTPDVALPLYAKLRNASHLSVLIERRGEPMTLDYTIK